MLQNNNFLYDLCEEQLVQVSLDSDFSIPEMADDELVHWDNIARIACPGSAPIFNPVAARWAGQHLYLLCRFIVDRQSAQEQIDACLTAHAAPEITISNIWSVDLFFRQLPRLHKIASNLSANDTLIDTIKSLSQTWVISTPGIPDTPSNTDLIATDPALWQLFIERIIETDDKGKITSTTIRNAIQTQLGLYGSLKPQLQNVLKELVL